MCGICGHLTFNSSSAGGDALERMLAAMTHRGPDDEGVFRDGPVALGMRRLSIIDLEGGRQPIFSEDGSKVVVLNGEIYNYIELRHDLQARGHQFATSSDTEVIVHLYEEKGRACVEDLNGMFAFAVWDKRQRTLMLARDRVGVKPLHYAVGDRGLVFASEIPSLLASGMVDETLDDEAIADYFTYFYIPGCKSIYRDIRKLAPAETMVWRGNRATWRKYWQIEYPPAEEKPKPIEHYAELYRDHLRRAVGLQLRSDVPLGVFLSGGLDSGSLVYAIAQVLNAPVQTFTVSFDDESYDESSQALATSKMYGTQHHEFVVGPRDMIATGDLLRHFGEPFGPFTIVQSHAISQYSSEHIKVALAGDGGDELFGGYQTYIASSMARKYLAMPAFLRRRIVEPLVKMMPVSDKLMSLDFKAREFIRGCDMFEHAGNMAWKIIFDHAQKRQLLTGDFTSSLRGYDSYRFAAEVQAAPRQASGLQRGMYCDLSMFLPDCVLTQTDRMSMAASQEVRVPILDHELIEFAAGVPDRYKIRGGQTKLLIRHALKDLLPKAVLNKPKTGFSTPIPRWMRGPLRDYVQDVLSHSAIKDTGIINPMYVRELLEEHVSCQADHSRRLWSLVSFVLWHENRSRPSARAQ
ncbi:MAG: asparagine synthase (glutamine-hydrolyzing) [Planctomycetes bacterium]|jgi:asparagine synthase (glutamine-hydrolysing)|nr:asparagine synthase (glutamine-hydrolyzing) [Planctomycetota bacterium]